MFSFRHLLILWFKSKKVKTELKINLNQFFTQTIAQKVGQNQDFLSLKLAKSRISHSSKKFLKSIYWFVTFGQNWYFDNLNVDLGYCRFVRANNTIQSKKFYHSWRQHKLFLCWRRKSKAEKKKKGYVIQSWHPLRLSLICSIM